MEKPNPSAPAPDAKARPGAVKVVDSTDLFERGQSELRLMHQGEEYRLRITRQGKLILTK